MSESGELAGLLGGEGHTAAVAEPAVADGSMLQIENRLS